MDNKDSKPTPDAVDLERTPAKLPYHPPMLDEYGSLAGLTLAVGGSGSDNFGKNPMQMRF